MDKELRILILEDVPADAELEEHELRKSGLQFTLKVVDTREAFLKELDEFLPALILSDYDLPSLDGLAALRIAKEKCPDVPFILVTGKLGEEFAIENLKKGATDYVLKSNLKRLVPSVNRALEEANQIRERKRAEQELRVSERDLKAAQKIAHVGSWDLDVVTGNLTWSDETFRIYGFEPREFVPTYEKFLSILHPEDHERVRKQVDAALSGEAEYNVDFRFVRPDGDIGWIYCKAEVTRDEQGKPLRFFGTQIDITELKRVEELLRESEEKYRSLAESSEDYIMRYDRQHRHTYMNPACLRAAGFSEKDIIGKTHRESGRFNEELCNFWEEKIEYVFDTGKPLQAEFEWESADGLVVLDWRLTPEFAADGSVKSVLGVSRDITKLKRAEEALKLEAQLLNAATDSIFLHDFEGNFIYINETACKSHGYTKDELLTLNLHAFDVPEYQKLIEPRIKELMEKGESTFESAHFHKDGSVMPVEVHARVIEVGGRKVVLSVARDITDRKKAEETIEKLLLQRDLILNSAGEGIFGLDVHGNQAFVNPAAAQMLGYTVDELIGRHSHTTWHHSKADGSPYHENECPIYSTLKDGKDHHMAEEVFWRKDGTSFPVSYTSTPIIEVNNIVGAVVTFLDITERKSIEEELKRLATTDTLTGALNRTKFQETIEKEIEKVKRYNQPLSIMLFDIDHFKEVNDRSGHSSGDYVLKTIAGIVRENIRKIDYFVRWGGEEFIILSSGTQLDEAHALAERIRKVIENYKFENVGKVTVSFGVTEFKDRDTEESFIKRVDDTMYEAKKKGKNRVEVSI